MEDYKESRKRGGGVPLKRVEWRIFPPPGMSESKVLPQDEWKGGSSPGLVEGRFSPRISGRISPRMSGNKDLSQDEWKEGPPSG